MSAELHARAREVFLQAIELPERRRAAFAREACGDDARLLGEVESLLAELDAQGDFLEDDASAHLPEAAPHRLPERVGDYRIIRLLGEGGMGVVYEAEQDRPQRRVALKILRHGAVTQSMVRRIHREAELLGRLRHSGIAQVHEAGVAEDDGGRPQPFFAMELIEGPDLAAWCSEQSLGIDGRLELMARVCDAVDHAHERGVIHRDLKPANILVHADGQPKVLDFGIARAMDPDLLSASLQTASGQLAGTLAYMSPEQFEGRSDQVGAPSDVHALGVILFELLTGSPPHDLRHLALSDALTAVRSEPRRLGTIDRRLRGDVEIIVGRALEREPGRRYRSAAALAADIRRHLRAEPIQARPPSALYRARKFSQRHRTLVTATLFALAALAGGTVIATRQAMLASTAERQEAEQRRLAEDHDYRARLAAAETTLRFGAPGEARENLVEAPALLRGWEWRHLLARLDDSLATTRVEGAKDLRFDGDGRLLIQSSSGGAVSTWTLDQRPPEPLAWRGPDGSLVVAPSFAGELPSRLALPHGLQFVDLLTPDGEPATRVHPCPAGSRLPLRQLAGHPGLAWTAAIGSKETEVTLSVCDWREGQLLFQAPVSPRLQSVALSPDRRRIAVGANAGWARLLDVETGKLITRLDGHVDYVRDLLFREDGELLLSASHDRSLRLWDGRTGETLQVLEGHQAYSRAVAFSPDGRQAASVGDDRAVRLWDLETARPSTVLRGHEAKVGAVAFSPDGRLLVSLDEDGELRAWSAELGPDSRTLRDHESYVCAASFHPRGRLLATGGWDGTVRIWDTETLRLLRTWTIAPSESAEEWQVATWVSFSPDGERLAVALLDGRTLLADLRTGDQLARSPGGSERSMQADWTADGLSLFTARVDSKDQPSRIRRFDGNDLSLEDEWEGLGAPMLLLGGGRELLAATEESIVCLSLSSDQELWRLPLRAEVSRLTSDREERWVVLVGVEGRVQVVERDSGRPIAELSAGKEQVLAAAFNPDGSRLATGGRDGVVRIWDTANWTLLLSLRGHSSYIYHLAFSADGSTLASTSGDYTVRLWSTTPLGDVSSARRRMDGRSGRVPGDRDELARRIAATPAPPALK